ncbi:MAG: hypothetical protein ACQETE_14090 [Bacteroidota bacterium]
MSNYRQDLDPVIEEYICDYVDDTMDPAIAEVFEEYLDDNEEVRAYVEASKRGKGFLQQLSFMSLSTPEKFGQELEDKIKLEQQLDRLEQNFSASTHTGTIVLSIGLIIALLLGGSAILL